MTEAELVEQLRSGDENAYQILLDRHLAPITAYVTRMMASNADTEDIVQETFLRLWTQGTRYNPATSKLTTWLHNIAHNLCIDHFRKHNRMVQEETADEPDEQEEFVDQLAHFEDTKHIEQSLMHLPERQRSAIIMCHYQGMSNRDAAVIMETSVEALESLMARGRRKLRKLLEAKI
jgi:RNA polymerase sigma-70 factor (ECF subfamily)